VEARLVSRDGKKLAVGDGTTAAQVRADLERADYQVTKVTSREQRRAAPAPYTTSKLQQDATNHLRFTAKRTMQIAQTLYEGVDLKKDGGQIGLITYIRTDSVRVSNEAIEAVRALIGKQHGPEYLPDKPNEFRAKKLAQEAHEAIRPTSMDLDPARVHKHLKEEQFRLYELVWDRFVASQMAAAVYDQTSVDVTAAASHDGAARRYGLRVSGRVLKFAGWLEAYGKGQAAPQKLAGEGEDQENASNGRSGNGSSTNGTGSKPAEEGAADDSVTGDMPEKRGIGRPSTYAEIISKVQARDYVEKMAGGQFQPTELGRMVVRGLVQSTLDFMDPGFTAKMEEDLDEVEEGRARRGELLKKFYARFRDQLDRAKKRARWAPEPEPSDEKCEECGATLLKRWSRHGWFLGCSNYPTCKFTRDLSRDNTAAIRETDITCDKCGKPMVIRNGRFGEFLACSGYPACKNARPVPLGISCPKCGGDIIEVKPRKRGGRTFFGCSNYAATPPCDFKLWKRPIDEPCPACGAPFLIRGGTKANPQLVCQTKDCGFKKAVDEDEASKAAETSGQSSDRSGDALRDGNVEAQSLA
ncbi:MAG: DNA topoisomerase, partial [Polyangiaceae bacterium]|nr:DNA topoisomerase [Polyangiaceae bacterium]